MMEPNREVLTAWAEALESDEYEQGDGWLTTVTEEGDRDCCLGVLCKLAVAAGVIDAPKTPHYSDSACYDHETEVLPAAVYKWAGLDDADPWLCTTSAATLNDSGYTFREIAERIRAEFHLGPG